MIKKIVIIFSVLIALLLVVYFGMRAYKPKLSLSLPQKLLTPEEFCTKHPSKLVSLTACMEAVVLLRTCDAGIQPTTLDDRKSVNMYVVTPNIYGVANETTGRYSNCKYGMVSINPLKLTECGVGNCSENYGF